MRPEILSVSVGPDLVQTAYQGYQKTTKYAATWLPDKEILNAAAGRSICDLKCLYAW